MKTQLAEGERGVCKLQLAKKELETRYLALRRIHLPVKIGIS